MKLRIASALVLVATLGIASMGMAQEQDYEKALQAHAEGEYEDAYIHLKNALQADPNLLSARILLAEVYFNSGEIPSAEKEADEALLLGADINLLLPVYGMSLLLQNKLDKLFELETAYDSFSKASRFEWALLKGQGLMMRGNTELAREAFESAADLYPKNVRSLNTLSAVYLGSGMLTEALALNDKAIEFDANNAKTWQLRGELSLADGGYERALEHFTRAEGLAEDDIRVLRSLAQVNLHLGNVIELKRYLDLILEISPDDPAATLLKAILIMGQGETELGESMLANLSDKLSALNEAQVYMGDTMHFIQASAEYISGNDQSAISLLNTYLTKNPRDLAAIRMQVDLYSRNGNPDAAMNLLASSKSEILFDLGLSLQLLQFYIGGDNDRAARELLAEIQAVDANHPYVAIFEARYLSSRGKAREALALLVSNQDHTQELLDYDLQLGALQLQLEMYDAALSTAQLLQERYPEYVQSYNFAAVTSMRVGNLPAAQEGVEKALALAPENMDARFYQAMLLKRRGELEQAEDHIGKILSDRPGHVKAILLRANIYMEQGNYTEAITWSKKVYVYDRSSTQPARLLLEIYFRTESWDKALGVLSELLRVHPDDASLMMRRAAVHLRMDNEGLAQTQLVRVFKVVEDNPQELRRLAAFQVGAQNLAEARKCLETAVKLDPQSFEVRFDLARLNVLQGQYVTAIGFTDTLEREYGERAELTFLRGEIALAQSDLNLAQEHFLKAYTLDHSNGTAVIHLYQLSLQGIGGEVFIDVMESSLKTSSLPAWGVRLLADSYLNQGQAAKAAHHYENLLSLPEMQSDQDILNNLANIYAVDDLGRARVMADRAMAVPGDKSAAVLDTMGWVLALQGQNEEALPHLRKAFAKSSTDPAIRYHLGVALQGLGRSKEAERELQAALDMDVDFSGREQTVQLLATIASATNSQ